MQSKRFEVSALSSSSIVRLVCSGELDLSSAPELEESVKAWLERRPAKVTVDLNNITFIGSEGLRVLTRASQMFSEAGVAFSVSYGERVRRVIELAGLRDRLEVPPPSAV